MVTRVPGEQLLGRQREREVLDRVLETARGGHGGALAIYGEPGVGKTALLDASVETAPDFRVARAVGVEGEMGFPFAALHQLCSPSLDLLDRLPDPQREAFAVALGLSAGRTPNPFLVGLAVLNLLSDLQDEYHLSYIFISHDLAVVKYISDQVMVMNDGRIVEMANSDEIYRHPKMPYTQRLLASIPKGWHRAEQGARAND